MSISSTKNLHPSDYRWGYGQLLRKKKGSAWHGKVVGLYSTELTPIGYAIESAFEPGSVQIYPENALEEWVPEANPSEAAIKAGVDFALRTSLGGDYTWPDYVRDLVGVVNSHGR